MKQTKRIGICVAIEFKNPFGAGRKRAYIEYAKQIEKLHKDGLSIRKISKELCIPSATIARYIKASYQNNYEKK